MRVACWKYERRFQSQWALRTNVDTHLLNRSPNTIHLVPHECKRIPILTMAGFDTSPTSQIQTPRLCAHITAVLFRSYRCRVWTAERR